MQDAIRLSEDTLVIMDSPEGGPLQRVWCLYEIWCTLAAKGPGGVHRVLPDQATTSVFADFKSVDLHKAKSSEPYDVWVRRMTLTP